MKKILFILIISLFTSGLVGAQTHYRKWSIQGIDVACLNLGNNIANCYIVSSKNRDSYIIDPGGNATSIIAYIKENNLNVLGYLITHGHNDHIRGLIQLIKKFPAIAAIHASDLPLYRKRMGNNGPFKLFFKDRLSVGTESLSFTVIHTPGHSPGGVCFYFKEANILFTGDTLFKNGIGRTDMDGGSYTELLSSLEKIRELPAQTLIFPGHGDKTLRRKELPSNI